jgi:hypothetical protein
MLSNFFATVHIHYYLDIVRKFYYVFWDIEVVFTTNYFSKYFATFFPGPETLINFQAQDISGCTVPEICSVTNTGKFCKKLSGDNSAKQIINIFFA